MPVLRRPSPAARCVDALRAEWSVFVGLAALGVAAATAITAAQPRLYRSQALLSVKPPPEIVAAAIRTKRPYLGPDGHIYDANDPERQTGPGRYAPRLVAPGAVAAAAHEAGILPPTATLDDRQAAAWASAERIEGADLIRLTVWQPNPFAAERLAETIVARGIQINRRDEANVPEPELRRILLVVDRPTHPVSPAYPRWDVNLSVGLALGVLAAGVWTAARRA
jgi:hypothetical protein